MTPLIAPAALVDILFPALAVASLRRVSVQWLGECLIDLEREAGPAALPLAYRPPAISRAGCGKL